jgi:hypothetical protein
MLRQGFSYALTPCLIFSQDIPALAAEASKEHSNIPYIVTAPLGLHELMVVCACEFPLLFLSFSAAVSREAK